jgi:type IV pilus assembly protein PilC
MTEFICRLGTPSGEIVTRVVEAAAAAGRAGTSRERGLQGFCHFIDPSRDCPQSCRWEAVVRPRSNRPTFFFSINNYRQLLRAGIPVLQAIGLLKTRSASATLRTVLTDVEDKIRNGVPLSEAFEAQGIFPKIYTASLLAGEKSGALDDVLSRFVTYLKRSVGVSRKLRGALAYPAFLLLASSMMVAFLSLYIVPRMSDLFKSLAANRTLPTVTLVVLWFSNGIVNKHCIAAALALIVGLVLFVWLRTKAVDCCCTNFSFAIPIGGQLVRQHDDGSTGAIRSQLCSRECITCPIRGR